MRRLRGMMEFIRYVWELFASLRPTAVGYAILGALFMMFVMVSLLISWALSGLL